MTVLGVVGAGTMGAGIAQLGAAAGFRTLLHDPMPEALERGAESARRGLAKWAGKGRVDAGAAELLEPVSTLDELAPCELVIEAAPERAELKRDLFGALSMVCGDEVVLATNTSSIPVTSLAGAAARPEMESAEQPARQPAHHGRGVRRQACGCGGARPHVAVIRPVERNAPRRHEGCGVRHRGPSWRAGVDVAVEDLRGLGQPSRVGQRTAADPVQRPGGGRLALAPGRLRRRRRQVACLGQAVGRQEQLTPPPLPRPSLLGAQHPRRRQRVGETGPGTVEQAIGVERRDPGQLEVDPDVGVARARHGGRGRAGASGSRGRARADGARMSQVGACRCGGWHQVDWSRRRGRRGLRVPDAHVTC